jgi:large subunit ribosomal protein L18
MMIRAKAIKQKQKLRLKRKRRVRGKIFGNEQIPRVSIFKSNKYVYAQVINDDKGITLCSADSRKLGTVSKDIATKVGEQLAEKMKKSKIQTVVFDRNGYNYHGVVASFADALRDNGIKL